MTELFIVSSDIYDKSEAIAWANSMRGTLCKGGASLYLRPREYGFWRVLCTFTEADLYDLCMRSRDASEVDETRYVYMKRSKRLTKHKLSDILIGV